MCPSDNNCFDNARKNSIYGDVKTALLIEKYEMWKSMMWCLTKNIIVNDDEYKAAIIIFNSSNYYNFAQYSKTHAYECYHTHNINLRYRYFGIIPAKFYNHQLPSLKILIVYTRNDQNKHFTLERYAHQRKKYLFTW